MAIVKKHPRKSSMVRNFMRPQIVVPKMPALSGHHTGNATRRYRRRDAVPGLVTLLRQVTVPDLGDADGDQKKSRPKAALEFIR
jgi:hypothetical protein